MSPKLLGMKPDLGQYLFRLEVRGRYRMAKISVSAGVVHEVPADLSEALVCDQAALAKWEDITPLARNEWICWVESVKKPETRRNHVERTRAELKAGKRRPCCWPGCPHRKRSVRRKGSESII